MELEVHPIQADILLVLLFKPQARFRELNTTRLSTDHFTFHVRKLVKEGLIKKTKSGEYQLTTKGKEFANRFDTDSVVVERQAKIGALVVCVRQKNGRQEYLVQKRLKQPYYGFHGFMTGKIRWGETFSQAAARELKEETNLTGTLKFVGIKHKMDYAKAEELLEDKVFFVFRATNLKGKLRENFEGGQNLWLTEKEILRLPDLFHGVAETIKMVAGDQLVFKEAKYLVTKY